MTTRYTNFEAKRILITFLAGYRNQKLLEVDGRLHLDGAVLQFAVQLMYLFFGLMLRLATGLVLLVVGAFLQLQVAEVVAQDREEVSWNVDFEGNETYSRVVLRDVIATSRPTLTQKIFRRVDNHLLREQEVMRDVVRLERFYQRRGFDRVEVDYRIEDRRRDWKKRVVFMIDEGEPLRISRVSVDFNSSSESEEIIRESRDFQRALSRHDFQPGDRYQSVLTSDVEGLFVQAMQQAGYAYANVEIGMEIDQQARQAEISLLLDPGPRKTFTSFNIIGDLSVDERIVIRETGIQPGDTFSRSKMQTAQRELFNHHLFRFATVSIPESPTDSTLELTMRVREYPLRSVEASIGFGREEMLRGQLTWQHRNVNQWAHRFSASARASFIEQRAGFEYLVPYLFNTRSSFVSSPYLQRRIEPAFELLRVGFNNSTIYQYNPNLTGSLSYELTFNEEISRREDAVLPDTVLNFNTASLTISGYYNSGTTRDQQGWLIHPFVEFSSLFDEATFKYQKASIDMRRYTRVTSRMMIAKRLHGGVILTREDDLLPAAIRFYSGGTNSVRGWSRQTLGPKIAILDDEGRFDRYVPIGGRSMFNFNIEIRQDLSALISNFGIGIFLDGGQVWRSARNLSERPVQFGTGGGLRYNSPIGPIRIDVGYKINPADEDLNRFEDVDYSSGLHPRMSIHFSIGHAF